MRYSDKEIIHAIQENKKNKDDCLKFLYRNNYAKAVKFFARKGIGEEMVKDVFQDSVIVFYEKVKDEKYKQESSISTFLIAVMNNMINSILVKENRKLSAFKSIKYLSQEADFNIEDHIISREQNEMVFFFMGKLKDDCKKILGYFYFHKMTMQNIAEEFGFKNEQIARNKKLKCLKYLQDIIKSNINELR